MEWISVDNHLPKCFAGKFRVRMQNNDEKDAFYYADAMAWISFYGQKTSNWWESSGDHKRLDNVTHWMPLPSPLKD